MATAPLTACSAFQMYNDVLGKIINVQPAQGLKAINVLLVGGKAVGKSSFLNSSDSVFAGSLSRRAPYGQSPNGITKSLRMHSFRAADAGCSVPKFRLWDTKGWEGMSPDDLSYIINGYVPDRTDLSAGLNRRNLMFKGTPDLEDQMHTVLFVVPYEIRDSQEYFDQLGRFKEVVFES
eukprot:evm.model.scf_1069.4 EVM.evm.TU.scf_1069.4   scf_1069:37550-38507(-)